MTIGKRRMSLAIMAALITTALLAPQGQAAEKVTSGSTVLELTAKGSKELRKRHIKVRAAKPGTSRGRRYRLPVKSGTFDFNTNRGTLTEGGSLRLSLGRKKVTISAVKISLGRGTSRVVAKIGGRRVTLGFLTRRGQKVQDSSSKRTVSRVSMRLSKGAATLVQRKLGGRRLGLRALASLTVAVTKPPKGAADTAAAGQAKVVIAPGLMAQLLAAGLDPAALPGSEQLPDGSITLPVGAVNIDPQTGHGTIDLAGGLTLGSGANAVTIDNPQVVIDADGGTLYAQVNGVRVRLAGLENSGLAEALQSGLTQLQSTVLTLSPELATLLTQAGGVSVFVPGTPFGDVSVSLPSR